VELRTVERRGKSLIPWSRMEMEESRSWREDLRDCTEAEREDAELAVDIVALFGFAFPSVLDKLAAEL
jgi:hypothetical protein